MLPFMQDIATIVQISTKPCVTYFILPVRHGQCSRRTAYEQWTVGAVQLREAHRHLDVKDPKFRALFCESQNGL